LAFSADAVSATAETTLTLVPRSRDRRDQ
jgi:hypothetical protein